MQNKNLDECKKNAIFGVGLGVGDEVAFAGPFFLS